MLAYRQTGDKMNCKSICGAIAVACLSVLPATAFDYSGLRSGMSFSAVNDAAARAALPQLYPAENVDGLYTLGPPNQSTVNMTFCRDKLFALTSSIQGGVDAYAQLASDLVQRYGQPTVQPTSQYTEQGLLSSVRMTWPVEGGETVAIDITAYRERTSVSRSYSAFDVLCQK